MGAEDKGTGKSHSAGKRSRGLWVLKVDTFGHFRCQKHAEISGFWPCPRCPRLNSRVYGLLKRGEKITITNDKGRLTEEQIEKMIREAEEFADEDKKVKERVDAKNAFDGYVHSMRSATEGSGDNKGLSEKMDAVPGVGKDERARL